MKFRFRRANTNPKENAMTKKTEKRAAKTTKTTKEPKMTTTEQAEVTEQRSALIADATPAATPTDAIVPAAAQPEAPATAETKKEPKAKAHTTPSTVENPVKVVHQLCDEMNGAPRKDVMAACLARGINPHTASTRIQKWRKARQAAK
jgi:hypothetical protein